MGFIVKIDLGGRGHILLLLKTENANYWKSYMSSLLLLHGSKTFSSLSKGEDKA